jgi:hypothetical protein
MNALFLLCLLPAVALSSGSFDKSRPVTTTFFNKYLAWKKLEESSDKEYGYIAVLEFCGDKETGVFGFHIPDSGTMWRGAPPHLSA